MKKVLFGSLLLLVTTLAFGQGVIIESKKMSSKLLGNDVKYSIYLPYDYQTSTKSYPVLYLLHGYTDDETGWAQWGQIDYIANKAISEGRLPACIIVMPNGEDTWYCNDQVKNYPWEDMFIKEFIPFIESNYRCRQDRGTRAIAGLSMGGWGALKLSMKHNDLFGTCIALSAAVFTDKELIEMPEDRIGERFASMFSLKEKGEKRITDKWKSESVFYLLKNIPKEQLKSVRYYIDCGDDDFLYRGNSELHIALRDEGINHEYRVRNGSHSWIYWRTGIDLAFEFLSVAYEH
jgi:enterochelin esterase-like enzyme